MAVETLRELENPPLPCSVCQDEFGENANALEMPCKHYFHKDCLLPWL